MTFEIDLEVKPVVSGAMQIEFTSSVCFCIISFCFVSMFTWTIFKLLNTDEEEYMKKLWKEYKSVNECYPTSTQLPLTTQYNHLNHFLLSTIRYNFRKI